MSVEAFPHSKANVFVSSEHGDNTGKSSKTDFLYGEGDTDLTLLLYLTFCNPCVVVESAHPRATSKEINRSVLFMHDELYFPKI